MKVNKKLAILLRKSRQKSGLTQRDVAKIMGYATPQFISNWERGRSCPPIKSLKVLSKLYKVDTDELFKGILELNLKQTEYTLKREYQQLRKRG